MTFHDLSQFKEANGFRYVQALGVNRGYPSWRQEWSRTVRLSPTEAYYTLSEGFPDKPKICIMSESAMFAEISFQADYQDTRRAIRFEGSIHQTEPHNKLTIDEMGVEKGLRGSGLGTLLFLNIKSFAKKSGVSTINLRAGREDGPVFWTKKGFSVELDGRLKDTFAADVVRGIELLSSEEKALYLGEVRDVLDDLQADSNQALLKIGAKNNGKSSVGQKLLEHTNPRMFLNLSNA